MKKATFEILSIGYIQSEIGECVIEGANRRRRGAAEEEKEKRPFSVLEV